MKLLLENPLSHHCFVKIVFPELYAAEAWTNWILLKSDFLVEVLVFPIFFFCRIKNFHNSFLANCRTINFCFYFSQSGNISTRFLYFDWLDKIQSESVPQWIVKEPFIWTLTAIFSNIGGERCFRKTVKKS